MSFRENSLPRDSWMARSTDPIGAPNVLASSRAPAQADIEMIDVNITNNVLIGNPLGFRKKAIPCYIRVNYGKTDFSSESMTNSHTKKGRHTVQRTRQEPFRVFGRKADIPQQGC